MESRAYTTNVSFPGCDQRPVSHKHVYKGVQFCYRGTKTEESAASLSFNSFCGTEYTPGRCGFSSCLTRSDASHSERQPPAPLYEEISRESGAPRILLSPTPRNRTSTLAPNAAVCFPRRSPWTHVLVAERVVVAKGRTLRVAHWHQERQDPLSSIRRSSLIFNQSFILIEK